MARLDLHNVLRAQMYQLASMGAVPHATAMVRCLEAAASRQVYQSMLNNAVLPTPVHEVPLLYSRRVSRRAGARETGHDRHHGALAAVRPQAAFMVPNRARVTKLVHSNRRVRSERGKTYAVPHLPQRHRTQAAAVAEAARLCRRRFGEFYFEKRWSESSRAPVFGVRNNMTEQKLWHSDSVSQLPIAAGCCIAINFSEDEEDVVDEVMGDTDMNPEPTRVNRDVSDVEKLDTPSPCLRALQRDFEQHREQVDALALECQRDRELLMQQLELAYGHRFNARQ